MILITVNAVAVVIVVAVVVAVTILQGAQGQAERMGIIRIWLGRAME